MNTPKKSSQHLVIVGIALATLFMFIRMGVA